MFLFCQMSSPRCDVINRKIRGATGQVCTQHIAVTVASYKAMGGSVTESRDQSAIFVKMGLMFLGAIFAEGDHGAGRARED